MRTLIDLADAWIQEHRFNDEQLGELSQLFFLRAKEMFEENFLNRHPELKEPPVPWCMTDFDDDKPIDSHV